MIEAVLRVTLPCSWAVALTRDHGAVVNIVEQKALSDDLLQSLVEIDPADEEPNEVVEILRRNPFVKSVEAIVPPKGKILATLQVQECLACQALANSECFLTDATVTEGGGLEWKLLAPKRTSVESLMKVLRDRDIPVELMAIKTAKGTGTLTDRQERVLSLAYQLGYFEFPKRINLSDLAKKLGVAKSTLSEVLRAGEDKILHEYFQGLMKRPR